MANYNGHIPSKGRMDDSSQSQHVQEIEKDEELIAWIKAQVQKEISKLESHNYRTLCLPVKNCGVVRNGKKVINRIEFESAYNFYLIKQILISETIVYPADPNVRFINVVMFSSQPMPLVFGYVFHEKIEGITLKNNLSEWLLINSKGEQARHKIDTFHSI